MKEPTDDGAGAACCHQTMLNGYRCEGCPLALPTDKLVPRRDVKVAHGAEAISQRAMYESPLPPAGVQAAVEGQFQRVTGTLPGGEATYRFADGVPAVAPAGPVVGPSGSDWVLVGYFMEDGGRWLKMDSIYADDPDAVGLYRKRYAGVAGGEKAGRMVDPDEDTSRDPQPKFSEVRQQLVVPADGVVTHARCAHHPSKCPHWEDCRARQECVGAPGVTACAHCGLEQAHPCRTNNEARECHAQPGNGVSTARPALLDCGICGTKPGPDDLCFCPNCGAVLVTREEADAHAVGVTLAPAILVRPCNWPKCDPSCGNAACNAPGVSVPANETPAAGTLAHHTVKFTVGNAFYSMTPEQASFELQEVYERRDIDWGAVDEELRQIVDEAYRKDVLPDLRALLRRVSGQ